MKKVNSTLFKRITIIITAMLFILVSGILLASCDNSVKTKLSGDFKFNINADVTVALESVENFKSNEDDDLPRFKTFTTGSMTSDEVRQNEDVKTWQGIHMKYRKNTLKHGIFNISFTNNGTTNIVLTYSQEIEPNDAVVSLPAAPHIIIKPAETNTISVKVSTNDKDEYCNWGEICFKLEKTEEGIETSEYYSELGLNFSPIANKTKELEVSGLIDSANGEIVIPTQVLYQGTVYNVTKIADNGFANCTQMTSIHIPNSITEIGVDAFSLCSNLNKISYNANATTTDAEGPFNEAGSNVDKLDLIIGAQVTSISQNMFYYSNIATIDFSNCKVTNIWDNAFSNCYKLESVTLPETLTQIRNNAFANCLALGKVDFNENLVNICDGAFAQCSKLHSIEFSETQNKLTTIGNNAFLNCSGLNTVIFPQSLTSIGEDAFLNCRWINTAAFRGDFINHEEYVGNLETSGLLDALFITVYSKYDVAEGSSSPLADDTKYLKTRITNADGSYYMFIKQNQE